ncbi:MAG: RHS repeat-associated core domain-containing protein, partial [Candidatus Acidiferrales bacterium]
FFSMSHTAQVGTYDYNWHWYDAVGRRVITQRTTGSNWAPSAMTGGRTFYVYDGNDVALTIVRTGSGAAWVKARYLTGGVDDVIAGRFRSDAGVTQNLALINDRQGTTLAAMRGDGSQEDNATYFTRDPYGGLIGASGPGGAMSTETGFTGASTPNQTGGFVYLRNRWYDPQTGRFLTQDPIGLAGGVNLYSYAGSNPVNFSDPFGLNPCRHGMVAACLRALAQNLQTIGTGLVRAAQWIGGGWQRMFQAMRGVAQSPAVQQSADNVAQAAQRIGTSGPTIGPGTQRLIEALEGAGPGMDARIQAVAQWLPQGQRALMTTLEGGAKMLSGGAGERARQIILNPDGTTIIKAFNVGRETFETIRVIAPQ